MTEIKTLHQIEEETHQISILLHDKIYSIPEELTKIIDSIKDKQSEIRLKIDAGLGEDYCFLDLYQSSDKVNLFIGNYLNGKIYIKHGRIPKKKYKSLWKILEDNDVWNLESLSLPIMDADEYSIFLSKDRKRNNFNLNGLISPILTKACTYLEQIDETTIESFEKYSNIITEIRKLSKYAKRKTNLGKKILKDIAKKEEMIKEKQKEREVHPFFISKQYKYKGELDKSLEFCKKSIEYNPQDYDAQYHLAMLYEQTGKKSRSIKTMGKIY